MILNITININFSSFPHSLFFYLPLVATIILDFSLRLTHTFCYSSPLPTDFLSFSLYFSFFSLFLHLYSFLRIPVPSFRRAIHTSILPLHAMPSLSLSPFRWRSSTSLLFRLRFVLFALFLTPSSRSCATLPLRSSFSSTLCSSFSVLFSHTSHSSSHIPSRSCFRSRFRSPFIPTGCPPLSLVSSSFSFSLLCRSLWRCTSLSSRSIELRSSDSFYLARSSYFLLFLFFCAFSLFRLSSSLRLPLSLDPTSFSSRGRSASRS